MDCESQRALLPAYVDGELDLVRQVEIEAHLASCPPCAQIASDLREAKMALREALPRYAAPPHLVKKIRAALPAEQTLPPVRRSIMVTLWPYLGMAASLAVMLAAGFVAGWHQGQINGLTEEAITSHARSLMAQHLMDVVSTDQHTVKPWFAGKIDFAPPVADLAASGFPLVGGRLDLLDHRSAAALVYQRRKHFINLFIWPDDTTTLPERETSANGYQTESWSKNGLNFLAVSEIPAADLAGFVQAYRAQTGS
jgi:anti-sigma factor RsiW